MKALYVAYKTKQIFDPNYRERARPMRSRNTERRGGVEANSKLYAWLKNQF